RHLREVRGAAAAGLEPGQTLTAEAFSAGDVVDVIGNSRGKGFAGAMKRHGFSGQRDSHGVSLMHRAVGSIGQSNIARVFPGKRMPGRMGRKRVTVRGLRVVQVDAKRNLLLVRGATPGIRGALLTVRTAAAAATEKPAAAKAAGSKAGGKAGA
ncbi:MAG: 50S ribosomal protein L3, partial [bacterium]